MATFEFDHLFIGTDAGGAEAERLVAFGLTEGAPDTHSNPRESWCQTPALEAGTCACSTDDEDR